MTSNSTRRRASRAVIDEKLVRMTTAPVRGLVVRMALPTIAIMLISAMYNMADTYFVSTLGTTAAAAVGVSFSLMALIQAFGFFFGQGAGNYISRQFGAGNVDNAARMAAAGFAGAVGCGTLVAVAGLLWLEPLALFLGSTPTILPEATAYLRYILLGAPFMASAFALNTMLRFQGSANFAMIGMTTGAVLNVILDPIFIFVLGMGVSGASLATLISQMVGFSLLMIGSAWKGNVPIRLSNLPPARGDYWEIVRGGFPSLCRQGLMAVAVMRLNKVAGQFGDAAIAAMSIVQRVFWFAGAAMIGWGQGFQPVCGFNFGAGKYKRVREAFWFCIGSSTAVLVVLGALACIFAREIVTTFRPDDPDVIAIGTVALRFQSVLLPTAGYATLNNMMLQTIGRAGRATILALARQGLFMLPLLFVLTPRIGILGVQLAQPLADVLTFLLSLPLGLGVLRNMERDAGRNEVSVVPTDDV
ncbi:MAG: MATE family efflux transporter [Planctomycetes bacterium]|nr:MATE family efflux transporter [Planctomycetota bacterium]